MTALKAALLAGVVALAAASVGTAQAYPVTVSTGLTGSGFNTTSTDPFAGANTATASFTYTGPIAFSDTAAQNAPGPGGDLNSTFGFSASNVSGYSGSGTVTYNSAQIANFTSLASYLGSSGSASNFTYGSWYSFDLGSLSAGTILTITHDDGASVYQNGVNLGGTTSGATTATTDTVKLSGVGDTVLYYSRQNGSPSILTVAVPEPMSLTLMGAGLIGLGMVRRRRRG